MTRWRSAWLLSSALALGAAPPRPAAELVVSGDGIVAAMVADVPGRIRIDPAAPSLPILSASWAGRAQLRPGPFAGIYQVGPQQVRGVSAVTRIGVGAGAEPRRRRVGWTARPYLAGADGVIGPGGLPQRVIRFRLRASLPGERTVTLPLVDEGGLFGGWGAVYALIQVDGAPVRIRFNPHHPQTLATAGTGVRLAGAFDGRLSGAAERVEIAFGIARPVRTLRLGRPLLIGPLAISSLGVRTNDFGDASAIPEEGGDPDEIVVTGRARGNGGRDKISLGADSLARCSSIIFDKAARQVRLTCA